MKKIHYAKQSINREDINAVIKVLNSDFLTQGPVLDQFEEKISNYCDVNFTVATNSATSALHISCLAIGIGSGDIVWTTPNTFVASANCVLYCNASIDFVDIDPQTYNICPKKLSEKLIHAKKNGSLPKALIVVHFGGQVCDLESIFKLSQQYGFKIIEDASHAIGAKYKEKMVGCCFYSEITVFSFHPVKIITTGEGGAATTNNPILAKRLRLLRSHGITSDKNEMHSRPKNEIWNYQQISLGFNYRMTEIHAALGLSQMKRIDDFILRRRIIAKRYDDLLSEMPVVIPIQLQESFSAYHLYVIRLKTNEIKKSNKQIFDLFRKENIFVNLHYIPIYRQPYYEKMGFKLGYCQEAESFFSEALSLPIYADFNKQDQDYVLKVMKKIFSE